MIRPPRFGEIPTVVRRVVATKPNPKLTLLTRINHRTAKSMTLRGFSTKWVPECQRMMLGMSLTVEIAPTDISSAQALALTPSDG